MSREIFISHAVKDKELADALIDLLVLGLDISSDIVFCSSADGLGIPGGKNFVDYIKNQIQTPKVVLALLTPNYFDSPFCLCELGAAWAMSLNLKPLLIAPLGHEDMKAVLTGMQVTSLNRPEQLSQLVDELRDALDVGKIKTARWESKRNKFLKNLDGILEGLPTPKVISQREHGEVLEALKDAKSYIEQLEEEKSELEEVVSRVSQAKDKGEVASVKRTRTAVQEEEKLESLEKNLKEHLLEVSPAVAFMAFKELALGEEVKLNSYADVEASKALKRAEDYKLVSISEDGMCSLHQKSTKIKRIINAFEALETFVSKASAQLHDNHEENYDVQLDLQSREYWEYSLDSRIANIEL